VTRSRHSAAARWQRSQDRLDAASRPGYLDQREVGASYFDQTNQMITHREKLSAVHGSTEEQQFEEAV
jgi:isocitrate lyase